MLVTTLRHLTCSTTMFRPIRKGKFLGRWVINARDSKRGRPIPLRAITFRTRTYDIQLTLRQFRLTRLFRACLFTFTVRGKKRAYPSHEDSFLYYRTISVLLMHLTRPPSMDVRDMFHRARNLLSHLRFLITYHRAVLIIYFSKRTTFYRRVLMSVILVRLY